MGKSCETLSILSINDYVNCLNNNKQIDAIFLKPLIYRVPHNRLYTIIFMVSEDLFYHKLITIAIAICIK